MQKIFILFYFISTILSAQSNNWWVYFSDKECDTSISLSNKSLERRLRQNIQIDIHDYTICQDYIDSLKNQGIVIRNYSRWLNAISISVDSENILDKISKYSFVKYIKPVKRFINNHQMTLKDVSFLNPLFRMSMSFPYGSSFNQIDMLGGVDLHNEGFLGDGIVIAVFDAGFTSVQTLPVFDNLWNNNQILDTYDFVDNDIDVFGGSSHGTMVLSTMGGYMVDSLIGTAPEASYMLFRTEDSNLETLIEEDNWAAAAEYADSAGVDIINSSLGYTILYDDTLNSHSYADMDGNSTIITKAADLAASRGILVINSAGNSGSNDWYYIGAPADGDSVLSVGAVNAFGDIASFSSRGPSYDGRIKPNVCAQGVLAVVADLDSTIRVANGTSFSAPIIAGLSACLWGALSTDIINIDNMTLFQSIQQSAHLFQNPNDSLGYGIPNFYQAYLNSLSLSDDMNNINLYPNPYLDKFSIYNHLHSKLQIDIFNNMGALIFSKYVNVEKSIIVIDELANIAPGIYFIKINQSEAYPIIKQ
jgi:serine protease AprX